MMLKKTGEKKERYGKRSRRSRRENKERRLEEDYIELHGTRTIKHLGFAFNRNEGSQLFRYATVFSYVRTMDEKDRGRMVGKSRTTRQIN